MCLLDLIAGELGDSIQPHTGGIIRHQRVRHAAASSAARAADAVDVILVFKRHVVVEHRVHVVDVDAAGGHVGRDEDRQLAAAEARHDGLALFLRDIAVDAVSLKALHHQKCLEPLCHALRVAERHHALVALGADNLRHDVGQNDKAHVDAVLRDIGLILLLGLHGDLLGVALIDPGDVHHLAADRRGEHAEVFAVRDESGKMVILPTRGNNYLKKVWLEKTAARKLTAKESRKLKAIYDGRKTDRTWIDMVCDERSCLYKNRIRIIKYGGLEIDGKDYDLSSALGSNFYIDSKNVTVKTVRGAIGRRLWNN